MPPAASTRSPVAPRRAARRASGCRSGPAPGAGHPRRSPRRPLPRSRRDRAAPGSARRPAGATRTGEHALPDRGAGRCEGGCAPRAGECTRVALPSSRPVAAPIGRGAGGPVATTEEDLQVLDQKLKQLRLDYEQYFLGSRPREPVLLRGEVQKLIALYSNVSIQNTAQRFKFSSLCSRYLTQRRQWDLVLRKIEDGTY